MSDESPPPYSAVVATPFAMSPGIQPPEPPYPAAALPFGHSDSLAAKILALVSEGKTLDSRFKDLRDVVSAGAKFEYEEHALVLCQRFEALIWESRNVAGVALVAMKDFNEIVLDFLSEPDVVVQDRLKELANTSRLLHRERNSVTNQKSSFDALVKELEEFHQTIHSESGTLTPKRRRQSQSGGKETRGTRSLRKSRLQFVTPRSEALCGLSAVTASLGAISRSSYALQVERIAEQAVFPSCAATSKPLPEVPAKDASTCSGDAPLNLPERKRLCPSADRTELAALPSLVDELVHDLHAFVGRIDVFDTVFAELARAQDNFIVYLKDGQSIADQGYRFEINRLRRHLPSVCNALDAYSKARLS